MALQPKLHATPTAAARPWWREPYVWLVVGGPLAVVIAGIATVVIAVKNPDPVLERRPAALQQHELLPANEGRNHAATPALPRKD